ncbi:MAG: tetratricopeptide repeat protein [Pseudomonadota bacterium]
MAPEGTDTPQSGSKPPISRVKSALLGLVGLFTALVVLHYDALHAPFNYDSTIFNAEYLFAGRGFAAFNGLFPQRPVAMVSLYVNYLATGMDPYGFRVVNALLLALIGVFIAGTLGLLPETPAVKEGVGAAERRLVPPLAAALFVIHPIQTYLLLYVWQRTALLSCLFFSAALFLYLATRLDRFRRRPVGYALCVLSYAAAVLSKENAVTLPAVLVLADIALFKDGFRRVMRRAALWIPPVLALMFVLSVLERPHGSGAASGILASVSTYRAESGLFFEQLFLTQCRVLFRYILIIALPIQSTFQIVIPVNVSESLTESVWTSCAVIGALGLCAAGIFSIRRRPLCGFGILFFIGTLVPESFLVPQYQCLPYRASLPMIGVVVVLMDGLLAVVRVGYGLPDGIARRAGALLAILAIGAGSAYEARNKGALWKDPELLWLDVVRRLPDDLGKLEKFGTNQAINNLASALFDKGSAESAANLHTKALSIMPNDPLTHVALARAYLRMDRVRDADTLINKALLMAPHSAVAHVTAAGIRERQGRWDESLAHRRKAVELEPDNPRHWMEVGRLFLEKKDPFTAAHYLGRSVEIWPRIPESHSLLGKALMRTGNLDGALRAFQNAVELRSDSWSAHNDMGVVFCRMGRPDIAIPHFRKAVAGDPANVPYAKNLEAAVNAVTK